MDIVVFDVDGTLTPVASSWHYLHVILGSRHRSSSFKRLFSEGVISYEEWVYLDLALWKGIKYDTFRAVLMSIPWRSGIDSIKDLVKRYRGFARFVAISCGFKELVDRCINELGFDYGVGVEVEVENGVLTGKPRRFVAAWSKVDELLDITNCEGKDCRIVAIGDSDVDIPLFKASNVSVAFCPCSRRVYEYCDIVVRSCDLRRLAMVLNEVLSKERREP